MKILMYVGLLVLGSLSAVSAQTTPDFAMTAAPANQSVAMGGALNFVISVVSSGGAFTRPVALAASGLPLGATVIFSPEIVILATGSASTTMTIHTDVQAGLARHPTSDAPSAAPMLALLLVLPFGIRRRTRARLSRWAVMIAAAGMLLGCESGGALPLTETVASQASYMVTVTGTSGSIQHSVMVEILVQTGSGLNT